MLPLFEAYPELRHQIPHLSLGSFPTPLAPLKQLTDSLPTAAQLWIKRDDLSSVAYGGNKVRKLEFTLAEALERQAPEIITGGGLGSHMANATAVFTHAYGIPLQLILLKQPLNEHVRHNLLLNLAYGAHLHYSPNTLCFIWQFLSSYLQSSVRYRRLPYLILPGNSRALSNLGYVNMAFELRNQIQAGAMPEPDAIFIAVGSCGTMAGLWLGLQLAGLKSRLIGVQVMDSYIANPQRIARQAKKTLAHLQALASGLPKQGELALKAADCNLNRAYLGAGYGHPTAAAEQAQQRLEQTEHMQLDPTYTAKTMAAMIDFACRPEQRGKHLLFVHTYATGSAHLPVNVCFQDLPVPFQRLNWPA